MCSCNKITICTEFDAAQIAGLQVPIASIHAFATQTVPDGYLICDGSAISRTEYTELFGALGTVWGAGDGTSTFNIPDLRGEFMRGFDAGRGVDDGRVFGTQQEFAIENITGRFGGSALRGGNDVFEGVFGDNIEGLLSQSPGASIYEPYGIDFDASRVVNTANETRPRNVAITYAIKAANPTSA
ncbi:MAG: tail fiber protein [Rhodospirillales bacterium]|nr:tail fiber protein [Rhodospirillales bacterium]